jgi:hypothetical protein
VTRICFQVVQCFANVNYTVAASVVNCKTLMLIGRSLVLGYMALYGCRGVHVCLRPFTLCEIQYTSGRVHFILSRDSLVRLIGSKIAEIIYLRRLHFTIYLV